jgi:hypothetical protein
MPKYRERSFQHLETSLLMRMSSNAFSQSGFPFFLWLKAVSILLRKTSRCGTLKNAEIQRGWMARFI